MANINLTKTAFEKPSLLMRITIGKSFGFIVGILGLIIIPYFLPNADWLFRIGILFWYTTIGAFISMFGLFTYHPVIKMPMPWWFRGIFLGAWMNFLLVLFTYDLLYKIMLEMFGVNGLMLSPYWFVLEGAIFGFITDYLCTKYGGEGKACVNNQYYC